MTSAQALQDTPPQNSPEVEAAYEAAPEDTTAEILDGELFVLPRPGRPHTRRASRLTMVLGGPFDLGVGGPGGWVILDEPEVHLGLGPDKCQPDLAGWRRERMPDALGEPGEPAHYELAPDWICEVLSPRTEPNDRGRKMRIYRREGVAHYWLLNPVQRTLEVYRLESARYALIDTHEGDVLVRAEPFEALDLDLAMVWAR